jgi:tetratricopeptide (TPR) repeat protein
VEDLQKIVGGYESTPAAPLAQLSLAARHFDEGQYDMARHEYAAFQEKHSEHPLLPLSEIGVAQCLEAGGQFQEAIDAFQAFEQKHPDHFLTPVAVFGRARCFEQMRRFAEAKAVYEDYIAAHPKDPWSDRAESALLFVSKHMRASETVRVATPVATP